MQREISTRNQLRENLNPLRDASNISSIDNFANLKDIFDKVYKLGLLCNKGETDACLAWYISSIADVSRWGQLYSIDHKKAYASKIYKLKKTLEFTVNLAVHTYANYSSLCLILAIQI